MITASEVNPDTTHTTVSEAAVPPVIEKPLSAAPAVAIEESVVPPVAVDPADVETGHVCSQCQHPMGLETTVCCNCGYYATIGGFVEIEKAEEEAEPKPFPWVLLWIPAVCLFIVCESMAGRFLTHAESPDRRLWSVSHLVVGLLLFVIPHLRAQYLSFREDSEKTGVFGFIFHPLAIWESTVKQLPKSLPWVLAASAGLTAVVCALLIGGLPSPFSKEPIQWEMKRKITIGVPSSGKASQERLAMPVEVDVTEVKAAEEEVSDKPRVYEDCVIVGYTIAGPESIGAIILGKDFEGITRLFGSISDLPPDVRRKLTKALRRIRSSQPFMEGVEGANWVKPKYRCRVWFHETENGGQGELHFERMLFLKKSGS